MPINNGVGSFPNPLGGPVGGASTAIGGTAGTAAVAGTTNPSLSAPGLPPPITPTGAAAASQAVPAATMDANMQMVGMIAQAILMAVQSMNASGGAPAPAAPKAASAGGASSSASTPPAAGGAKTPKALVIDDFSSNDNGFQHGTEVEKTIKQGAPNATVERSNISGQGAAGIANALQKVKDSADKPDVINISQFIGQSSADTQKVQQLIKDLTAQGVKVVVAAGNNGPNQKNALAPAEADTVSNGTNQSGPGNVTGSGRTTSFAAANRTAELLKGLK